MKKLSLLFLFITFLCGTSAYAAPVEGKTFTNVDHLGAYPTPQNMTASLSGNQIVLQWDGVHWPADGYPEEIDGRTVPTNVYYSVDCRTRQSGTTEWSNWWNLGGQSRYESNYGVPGAFLERVTLKRNAEPGTNYQFRVRCQCNSVWRGEGLYDTPNEDPDPIQDCYFSEWSDTMYVSRTLDSLIVSSVTTRGELDGKTSVIVNYTYKSSRGTDGEQPLYFTFKAVEIPDDGWFPEATPEGQKPYARRDGTPLTVQSLKVTCPDETPQDIDATDFSLKMSGKSGTFTWDAYKDLKNYHHNDVTIWVQGWERPATEGEKPRLVVDDAIGKVALDTRPVTAEPTADKTGILLTWPNVPNGVKYAVTRTADVGESILLTETTDTTYTDMSAEEVQIYTYEIKAFDSANNAIASGTVVGYRTLDEAELKGVSTRRPWNGTVDIDLAYKTVRNKLAQLTGVAIPERTVTIRVTTADGADFAVQSLVRETLDNSAGIIRRGRVTNGAFTLGANDRIIWDAQADAPRMRELNAVLKITIQGDEYSDPVVFEQTFDLDTRTRLIEVQGGQESMPIPWSTRWAKPGATQLGVGENEAWWKQTAVLTDVTDNKNPTEILRTEAKLGEGTVCTWTPKKWGQNTLTLILRPANGSNEQTEYAAVFYVVPDFTFTATQGNRDSIIVEWNSPKGMRIHSYSIRRRAANSGDAFVEIARAQDTTRWADTSDETIVGEFEYTVMPQTDDNTDVWTQFNPVTGYRALDIARPVTITPAENGTVTADKETAKYGDFVTLTVTPATGYELEQLRVMDDETPITVWSEEGGYVFNMPANGVTVTATFKAIDYIINIVSSENGTVTADKATANMGETVTLTITPDEGYELESLRVIYDDAIVPLTEGNTFVMRACNAAIIAAFKMTDYTITITPAENGTITADKETANMGETVTLTVTPNEGYELDQLTVINGTTQVAVEITTEGKYTFVMPAGNVEVSATYKAIYYDIVIVPPVSGNVTADKETANYGETVTLTITPNEGYEFDQLTVMNGTTQVAVTITTEGKYTFVIPAGNVVISTLFKMVDYTVTIMPAENGTVTADKATANMGETVTLTITPNEGYEFDQLTVMNGTTQVAVEITTEGKYIFVMPAGNVEISATYKAIDYTITIEPAENGTVTADKQTAHIGETVTLTITPNEGYELDQLTVMDAETQLPVTITTDGNHTFVMPAGNVVISTLFKMVDYTVTITPAENGTVTADKQTAHIGETITLTVTPDKGYELDEIHVMNGTTRLTTVSEDEGNHTFVMPANNVVISALFKETSDTGVHDATATDILPRKVLRDGQVYILRAGKTYTATGIEVK